MQSYFTKESLSSLIIPFSLITLAVTARIFGVLPNFSPVSTIALFAGTFLLGSAKWWVPFSGLIISDIFMAMNNTYGLTFWQYLSASPFVYLAFALVILLGSLNKKKNLLITTASVLGMGPVFFIVTNFFIWLNPIPVWSSMYAMSWDGLIACFSAAIPFYKSTLSSDVVYSVIIFGAYYLACTGAKRLSTTYS